MQWCSFCKHRIEILVQMQIENKIFPMGRFSWQAKCLHKRQDAAALAVRGGMGVSQANPPGVLSQARSTHHHQLSDLATGSKHQQQVFTGARKLETSRRYLIQQPLVINIRRKPVACELLGLHWNLTTLSFCKEILPGQRIIIANYS